MTKKAPKVKTGYRSTYHRDGTISYWAVYRQQWMRAIPASIPDWDLTAMGATDRVWAKRRSNNRIPALLPDAPDWMDANKKRAGHGARLF